MKPTVSSLESNRLSYFRTSHRFERYGEIRSLEDFTYFARWAKENSAAMVILGSGSNIFFRRQQVRTLVLKNCLPRVFVEKEPGMLEVSSSVMVAEVLKWCEERGLESCYYLGSVPATVGGAIAMNAGRGRQFNRTIFDHVQSVEAFDGENVRRYQRTEIPLAYRQTPFTGLGRSLIFSVVLKFAPATIAGNPRLERIAWSKENQDYSAPNCGSVFREYDSRIMGRLRGWRILSAGYSPKTTNWILNRGSSAWPIRVLILFAKILHRIARRKAHLEIIEVE